MRYIYILILLGINKSFIAQSQRIFNLGQKAPADKNACLVIKNKSKALKNINALIPQYQSIYCVKFQNFNSGIHQIDSLLIQLMPLTNLQEITFENCDLEMLETSFANFKLLEKIVVAKNSIIYENTLFPLLKDNKITHLYIETLDPDILTDSLYLLEHLKTISISSNGKYLSTNYSKTLQFYKNGKTQQIELAYSGDFYKPVKTKVKLTKSEEVRNIKINNYQTNLNCIKQPIPGISINDTLFQFHSTQKADFTYKSGSSISFFPNSFLSQSGEKYNGPVKIFYRELRNPVEIMLSGIPMTNKDEQGNINLFKSGGMYQINAFDNNDKPLNTTSDTAIQIDFAMTDTAQSFQFYNLNDNGSWSTLSNSVTTVNNNSTQNKYTKAVIEYYVFIRNITRIKVDTTRLENRFYNNDYIYKYRKDNFSFFDAKNLETNNMKFRKQINKEAFFRIKYLKLTKDKKIVYKIVKAHKSMYVPPYISSLFNKIYLYDGNLSKDQFKKAYHRKNIFWDVRPTSDNNIVSLDMKTLNSIESISGEIIYLKEDRTYTIPKKQGKILNLRIARYLKREAKVFNKEDNISGWNHNKLNLNENKNKEKLAYQHSLQYQNDSEKKMNYDQWEKYVKQYAGLLNPMTNSSNDNKVATALLKSGLGIKNIDCYIHSGEMQNVFVHYKNKNADTLSGQYHVFLYSSINTSYPLGMYYGEDKLSGYYFKKHNNYIIRFSNDGIMQVSKPNLVADNKQGDDINLDYNNQYNVKGMNSTEITRLILH